MKTNHQPSFRADLLTRRTYNRPLEDGTFETWQQTVERVIGHQQWLWERAKGSALDHGEVKELLKLKQLMMDRKAVTSGRTLWLGGTDIAKTREASQFNCSFSFAETVYDIVDMFWLLLQGCGVGFKPIVGILNGFTKWTKIEVIRSKRTIEQWEAGDRGVETNQESLFDRDGERIYHLTIGDSAEAWAKSVGKLLALKEPVDRIVLDFSQIRAAGIRLRGYGWISSGDETFAKAMQSICAILNKRHGRLLTKIDILDIMNHLGTTLSSRRSAEICLMDMEDPEAEMFIMAKKDCFPDNVQRYQSNNTLLYWKKPSKMELYGVFQRMIDAGGSEPGFGNGEEALRRAPWFKGLNPCAEILLGNKSFCNLIEVDLGKYSPLDLKELGDDIYLVARANYRQTCVNLKDGVLSDSWHELNEFLRLMGAGITGIVKWEAKYPELYFLDAEEKIEYDYQRLGEKARAGGYSMADELNLPRPKAVTTVKPSGTLSKIMDTTEGVHKPLGRYVFNNVNFSKSDPLVEKLRKADYRVFDNPADPSGVIVTIPVSYEDVEFDEVELDDGRIVHVNQETAVEQLQRYKRLMDNYVDHNCSITVSYDPSEVPEIVDWLYENWDSFVGVSWLFRNDPTKTAEDLGYQYLPQEVVDQETFYAYVKNLKSVDLDSDEGEDLVDADCSTGACPIR
ncbi:ribonucleoside-triphosphate reductase, adenosylcobalamin-dependent [Maritalea mediterranea]|uniref:Adenosylcobalamin-dependent ribonucleoside-triphosphate reductase n=1 Tax=Maritalea mediterranea TaxID=2909667 RepID=A0ABS9EDF6_9HYPH|nr:ribonucleoside-triphosphate reductase, adenosylcobalamin-dependent [Maritalea mediterranea]MCF4099795.1 ribonucleoside-triphosphate reductase, adenosylcobalamin-dependent [Maritalea mediterranea]